MGEARVGLGFDAHPWDEGRPLRLGGVELDARGGLAGHSDGDVVCHALADALLGAAALGDVGDHFPEGDPATAGISGTDLLARTMSLLRSERLAPVGCDLVVIAERPHLAERRGEIRESLAAVLGLEVRAVSVKATRPEGIGLTAEGVGCIAVAMVVQA